MKKTYRISIDGCDDSTIFKMDLTDEEADLLYRISVLSERESKSQCMPILDIEEVKE
jgi:hypothetical protein